MIHANKRALWCAALVGAFGLGACGKTKLAITTADKLAPPNAEAVKLFVSGAEQLKAGTPKALARAREQLEQAVARAPNLWEAHYDLGLALRKLDQLDPARASFLRARELAPDAPEPILALAECDLTRGDTGSAAALLEGFLARDPGHREARLSLSALYRARGDLDRALKHAREVLIRDPSETRALVEVGRVYRAQKELDVAELVLEKARAIDEKNAAIYNELGLLALDRGDTQLAFTQFAQASQRDARFAPAHMNQGSVLLKAGDFEAAERAYKAALVADAQATDAQIGLAIALRGQGKHKEAKAHYERVLREEPNHLAALYDLAVLNADFLDLRQEALALFERYLTLAPTGDAQRPLAQRYLEDIRMASGSTPP